MELAREWGKAKANYKDLSELPFPELSSNSLNTAWDNRERVGLEDWGPRTAVPLSSSEYIVWCARSRNNLVHGFFPNVKSRVKVPNL